ncbi:MAG TPA: hypothetical protein VEQ63_13395, partial [Bryobacteraceae bacterium]|nr:hypothetical protein [Bryobacteraceae bacterium]
MSQSILEHSQPVERHKLALAFGFEFAELYDRDQLARLDAIFLEWLQEHSAELHARLVSARRTPEVLEPKQYSELIIAVAPYLDDFIGHLFGITAEIRALQARHSELAPLFALKRRFVFKRAASGMTPEKAAAIDGRVVASRLETLFQEQLTESSYVTHVTRWLDDEAAHAEQLNLAAQYAAWAALSPAGRAKHEDDPLFKLPHKLDPHRLVPVESVPLDGTEAFR